MADTVRIGLIGGGYIAEYHPGKGPAAVQAGAEVPVLATCNADLGGGPRPKPASR